MGPLLPFTLVLTISGPVDFQPRRNVALFSIWGNLLIGCGSDTRPYRLTD